MLTRRQPARDRYARDGAEERWEVVTTSLDERLFAATVGTLELFSVYLGTRLGLYQALRDHGPQRSADLAGTAGIHPRYAREWLEQQAVAGLLTVDDPGLPADERRYRLPAEHAGVLTDPDDAAHVAPFADMLVGIAGTLDEVVAAYRDGGGVPYSRYGAVFRRGQGDINRPAFRSDLVGSWLPAIPSLQQRLERPGARVADVACGHGWSTIAVAEAYPEAEVVGYDADAASVDEARTRPFDAILLLEALHDLSRPTEVLVACRSALAPGGSLIVADEAVADDFTAPGDDLERMMYGWSISHCLPAAMAEQPSAAIGTVIRPDTVRALASDAGFTSTEIVDVDAGMFRLYRLVP
jgi:2-polyprenyl-3-methyl-5-hydroxy-6-metoxy-1,4-benzoquinol methylase